MRNRVINGVNDLTEQDKVLDQFKRLLKERHEYDMNASVKQTLRLSAKDISVLLAVAALVASIAVTLATIWK